MHAEIISIGSELTTGAKLDTNSQWLSLELAAVGIPVHYHTTVADDLAANVSVLRTAAERSNVVLITGGLGPTLDDLTRDALARLMGVEMVLDQPSLEVIRQMFARRNRPMPDRNVVQALFPAGSIPIPNRRGTAPGILIEFPRAGQSPCRIAAMPGVPSEMKVMFRDDVLPVLAQLVDGGQVIRSAKINCFGLGESAAEELLGDVTSRGRDPEVGITVHEATITLRIVAHAPTAAEAEQKIADTRRVIYDRMGTYAFGEEDDELEDVVVRRLIELGQTVATAELVPGGLLAYRLTSADSNARCYRGGRVVPGGTRNDSHSGVILDSATTGAEAGRLLAESCRQQFGSDFGVAIGECSRIGDDENNPTAPVVFVAVASASTTETFELNIAGDPAIARSRTIKAALNLLRLKLEV